jgi:glycosyltransferase involved in cell wall biosynthesis
LHASCAQSGTWPLSTAHRRFERAYLREEARWLPAFTHLLATSEADAERVRSIAPGNSVTVYRNALPGISVPQAQEEQVIGFSGNFEYGPNIQGVKFFVQRIWPLLTRHFPDLRLRLIGKNPEAVAGYVKHAPRIETTGPVDDAVAELAKVKIAVVPLVSGSGTRLKILEAWAAARPVVATSLGAEGLGSRPGVNIILADSPQTFAASIGRLLGSKEERLRIGCAARHIFEEGFTWETAWKSLDGDVFG